MRTKLSMHLTITQMRSLSQAWCTTQGRYRIKKVLRNVMYPSTKPRMLSERFGNNFGGKNPFRTDPELFVGCAPDFKINTTGEI